MYKKVFFVIVLGILLVLPLNIIKAADSADQSCDLSGGGGLGQFQNDNSYQTFTPSLNRLSKVRLFLDGGGGGVPVTLKIYHGGTQIVNAGSQNSPLGTQALTWDFTDVEVTPGDSTYRIWPQTDGGFVDWIIDANPNCYTGGAGYRDGVVQGHDFGFITYGWNYTAPAPAEDPVDDSNDGNPSDGNATNTTDSSTSTPTEETATTNEESTDQTSVAESEDNSNTSDTIKAPTALKAIDVEKDKGGSVKLTWQASETQDITNYEIFRSAKEKEGFTSLGKVDKNILEFVDIKATVNKNFYYYVRAIKGDLSSPASDTVKAKSLNNTPKTVTKNTTTEKKSYTPYIVGGAILLLAIAAGLIYYFRFYRKKHLPSGGTK